MSYDEFMEHRCCELEAIYFRSAFRDYLDFIDFCADEYEAYVLIYVKEMHHLQERDLPDRFAYGVKFYEIELLPGEIPF